MLELFKVQSEAKRQTLSHTNQCSLFFLLKNNDHLFLPVTQSRAETVDFQMVLTLNPFQKHKYSQEPRIVHLISASLLNSYIMHIHTLMIPPDNPPTNHCPLQSTLAFTFYSILLYVLYATFSVFAQIT